jgi:hypothetical protein
MAKKKAADSSKSAPGLVNIRLQLTAAERDRLRVVAAAAGLPMALWCRHLVRDALGATDGAGKKSGKNSRLPR